MIDFDAMMEKHREVRRKREALERVKANATNISAKITGMPSGGGDGQKMARDVVDIVMAEESYHQAEAELEEMKEALRPYLRTLKKWQHKDAIKLRYMKGLSIESVSDAIGYEDRQTRRFISEGREIIIKKMSYHVR